MGGFNPTALPKYIIPYDPNSNRPFDVAWKVVTLTVAVVKKPKTGGKQYVDILALAGIASDAPDILYISPLGLFSGQKATLNATVNVANATKLLQPLALHRVNLDITAGTVGTMMQMAGNFAGMVGGLPGVVGGGALANAGKAKVVRVKGSTTIEIEQPYPAIWVPDNDTGPAAPVRIDSGKADFAPVRAAVRRYKAPLGRFMDSGEPLKAQAGPSPTLRLLEFAPDAGTAIQARARRVIVGPAGAPFRAPGEDIMLTAPGLDKPAVNAPLPVQVEFATHPVSVTFQFIPYGLKVLAETKVVQVTGETVEVECTGNAPAGAQVDFSWEIDPKSCPRVSEPGAEFKLGPQKDILAEVAPGRFQATITLNNAPAPTQAKVQLAYHLPEFSVDFFKEGWIRTGLRMGPQAGDPYLAILKIAEAKGAFTMPIQAIWHTRSNSYELKDKQVLHVKLTPRLALKDVTCTGTVDDQGRAVVSFGGGGASAADLKMSTSMSPEHSHVAAIETLDMAVERITGFTGRHLKPEPARLKTIYFAFLDRFFQDFCELTSEKYAETHARRQHNTLQLANMMQSTRLAMVSYGSVSDLYLAAMDEFTGILFSLSIDIIMKIREKRIEAKKAAEEAAERGVRNEAIEQAVVQQKTLLQQLKDKLTSLKETLSKFLEERTAYAAKLKTLYEELEKFTKKVAELKTSLDESSKRLVDLDALIKPAKDRLEKIGLRLAELEPRVGQLVEKIELATGQATKLKEELEALARKTGEANTLREGARETLDGAVRNYDTAVKQVDALAKEIETTTGKLEAATTRVSKLTTARQEAAVAREAAERRIGEAERKVGLEEAKIREDTAKLATARDRLDKLPGEIATLNTRRNTLTSQIETCQGELVQLERNAATWQSRCVEIDSSLGGCRAKIADIDGRLASLEAGSAPYNALARERNDLSREIQTLGAERKQLQDQLGQVPTRRTQLESQADALKGERQEAATKIDQLYQEKAQKGAEAEQASDRIAGARRAKETWEGQRTAAETDKKQAIEKHDAADNELGPAKQEQTQLSEALDGARTRKTEADTLKDQRSTERDTARVKFEESDQKHLDCKVAEDAKQAEVTAKNTEVEGLRNDKKGVDDEVRDLNAESGRIKPDYDNNVQERGRVTGRKDQATRDLPGAEQDAANKQKEITKIEKDDREVADKAKDIGQEVVETEFGIKSKQEEVEKTEQEVARLLELSKRCEGSAKDVAQDMQQKSGIMGTIGSWLGKAAQAFWSLFTSALSWLLYVVGYIVKAFGFLAQFWMACMRQIVRLLRPVVAACILDLRSELAAAGVPVSGEAEKIGGFLTSMDSAANFSETAPPAGSAAQAKANAKSEEQALLELLHKTFMENLILCFEKGRDKAVQWESCPEPAPGKAQACWQRLQQFNTALNAHVQKLNFARRNADSVYGVSAAFSFDISATGILAKLDWIQWVAGWGLRVAALLTSVTVIGGIAFMKLADLVDLLGGSVRAVISFSFVVVPLKALLFLLVHFPGLAYVSCFGDDDTQPTAWWIDSVDSGLPVQIGRSLVEAASIAATVLAGGDEA